MRAAKPATKAARRSSPRMYRLKREKSALDARNRATATAVQKRMESTENEDFLLPDGPKRIVSRVREISQLSVCFRE